METPKRNNRFHIPLEIIQTYHSDNIHPAIQENVHRILEKNPECSYRLVTDAIGVQLIEKHFDASVLHAYRRLALGAAKGDFLRYVALYVYGGIYLDLDGGLDLHLASFLETHRDPSFVFFHDGAFSVIQWCFMVAPRQPVMLDIIHEMLRRIENGEDNIFLATGPTLVTDVWYQRLTHQEVYNCTRFIKAEERKKAWALQSSSNDNGVLLLEPPQLIFRFPGYRADMLYSREGNQKYIPTWNMPTPGFFLP